MANLEQADQIIRRFMSRADNLGQLRDPDGRLVARDLIELLARADDDLKASLQRILDRNDPDALFSELDVALFLASAIDSLNRTKREIDILLNRSSIRVMDQALDNVTTMFSRVNRALTDEIISVRVDRAARLRLQQSLLSRHATSVDRYERAMIGQINRIIATGIARGRTQSQMVDDLVQIRGPKGVVSLRAVQIQPGMVVRVAEENIPEGLFLRYRSWAWRIVRTEMSEAQNASHMASIQGHREQFPDIKKKILATFDLRTAMDSVGVHGQVRPVDGYFMDGAGRTYQRPPSRPNDREVVIPWRDRWSETRYTQPPTEEKMKELSQLSQADIERLRSSATRERKAQSQNRRSARVMLRPMAIPRRIRAQPRT